MRTMYWLFKSPVNHIAGILSRFASEGRSGFLCTRPPPRNKFGARLIEAISMLPNLHEILIAPQSQNNDVSIDVLKCLPAVPHLRRLSVNETCTQEAAILSLVSIDFLDHLTIANPSRAILDLLPAWLSCLSQSLTELHLEVSVSLPLIFFQR